MRRKRRFGTCIYCRTEGELTSEHVIPEMLGRFRGALTIHSVCRVCNNERFSSFEQTFGRDSAEAVFRLVFRIKDPKKANELGRQRVVLTCREPGDYFGAKLVVTGETTDGSLIEARWESQVIFDGKDTEPKSLLIEEITADAVAPFLKGTNVRVIGVSSHDEVDAILRRLRDVGWKEVLGSREDLMPSELPKHIWIRIDALIDEAVRRMIAKIAFNYLVHVAGETFASRFEFDVIRRCIQEGGPELAQRVIAEARSLETEGTRARYGDSHLLVLHWLHTDSSQIIAEISLFNRVSYAVLLAENVNAVWRDLYTTHVFDLPSRTVRRLQTSIFRILPIPGLPVE